MKKLLRASFATLLVGLLVGCGTDDETNDTTTNNGAETENGDTMNNGDTVNNGATNDTTGTSEQNVELADDVAAKISEMEEVEKSHVFVTNSNAYVAVTLNNGATDDKALETKIADKAREANADFRNVYVTLDPEHFTEFAGYETKIRGNEPVEGYFNEFTETVKRVFPHAE